MAATEATRMRICILATDVVVCKGDTERVFLSLGAVDAISFKGKMSWFAQQAGLAQLVWWYI